MAEIQPRQSTEPSKQVHTSADRSGSRDMNPELSPGALRFLSSHEAEGGEGSVEETTRRLVWVDVDPDALSCSNVISVFDRLSFGLSAYCLNSLK